jgi:hypothetical protein
LDRLNPILADAAVVVEECDERGLGVGDAGVSSIRDTLPLLENIANQYFIAIRE